MSPGDRYVYDPPVREEALHIFKHMFDQVSSDPVALTADVASYRRRLSDYNAG
jgi:hypothetical protein